MIIGNQERINSNNNKQYTQQQEVIPFDISNNPYYIQKQENLSPPISTQMKQNFINNNNINIKNKNNNIDSYNKQNDYNENRNNNINNDNKINNNINNKNNKVEDVVEDPDEYMFREQNKDKEESKKGDDESELSADSNKNSEHEQDFNDHLLAQYQKVKRIKNKWKVTLLGCVVQKDNNEYICGKVHGELERDW